MTVLARFEVDYFQCLNEDSQIVGKLPDFAQDPEVLIKLYRLMYLLRVFDTKAIALQRTGKLGTYPSTRGQEAIFVGVGNALAKEDIYIPFYRDVGALMQRGVKLSEILLYWGGDERGNAFADPENNFPYSVPVGSQPLHAAGAAAAVKYRKQKRAVVGVCGDGATSQGDFYEALNIAGVWRLPIVFIVCNNQWAISVPRSAQTAAQTLAQKAIAAGFTGEQVDGNDVLAVRERVAHALKKAREAHEPTLLELVCYRHSDHTTADDATRYEAKDAREREWQKEPIHRLRRYLQNVGSWSEAQDKALQAECEQEVEKAVQEYMGAVSLPSETMFAYLYKDLPKQYADQIELLKMLGGQHG